MNAASQITQLLQRDGELVASVREKLFGLGAGRQATREQPQPQRERDEPLLGPIVQVALQPPAFTIGCGHEPQTGPVPSPFLTLESYDGHPSCPIRPLTHDCGSGGPGGRLCEATPKRASPGIAESVRASRARSGP